MSNVVKHDPNVAIDTKRMSAAIEACTTAPEAKDIADKAAAIRRYLKKAGADLKKRNEVAKLEIEALCKAGELLKPVVKHGGHNKKQVGTVPSCSLADLGIEPTEYKRLKLHSI